MSDTTFCQGSMAKSAETAKKYHVYEYDQADFIKVDGNTISFTIQDGPQKEAGVNGCQIEHVIVFVVAMLRLLNKAYPCSQNSLAITRIEEGLHWMDARRQERIAAGVEGYNKPVPESAT